LPMASASPILADTSDSDMTWSQAASTYRERICEELSAEIQVHLWHSDQKSPRRPSSADIDLGAPVMLGIGLEWFILLSVSFGLLFLDLFVLQKFTKTKSMKNHVLLIFFWLAVAVLYAAHIWSAFGPEQGFDWCFGYLLEVLLSLDNLIVFSLILSSHRTPACLTHKALFFGLIGAVLLRLLFFEAVNEILKHRAELQIVMGSVLMLSGALAFFENDEDEGDRLTTEFYAASMLGSRLDDTYDVLEGRLISVRNGKYCLTKLAFIILLLEITDIMFAIDSVSAKMAAVQNMYVAFSSTVIAMFGIRTAFFVVHLVTSQYKAVKFGVAFIVTYIGVSLILAQFRYVPEWSTAAVSGLVAVICLIFAMCKGREHAVEEEADVGNECQSPYKSQAKLPVDTPRR